MQLTRICYTLSVIHVVCSTAYGDEIATESLERARAQLHAAIEAGELAGGAHLVVLDGKTRYLEVAGACDIEDKRPFKANTIVRIYSMTKPITSVAAITLYEKGKFQLDDPVAKFIPAFAETTVLEDDGDSRRIVPAKRPITVRDVFRHTTGYSYGDGSPNPREYYQREGMLYRPPAGMLPPKMSIERAAEALARIPALHHPGERFTYGFSTDLLGRLIEVWSKRPLDEYLRQTVFEPLEMPDTGFSIPKDKRGRFASCHTLRDGKLTIVGKAASSAFNDGFEFLSGGGGLVSTIQDYANFCQMLVDSGKFKGERLLKTDTVKLMFTDQLNGVAGDFRFGLGFAIGEVQLGSGKDARKATQYSWGGYASTDFRLVPEERLFQIFMRQRVPSSHGLANRLFPIIYTGTTANAQSDRAERPQASAAPEPVIVPDDLGYSDTGAYRSNTIPTPHIDALPAGGVRFSMECCAATTSFAQPEIGDGWEQSFKAGMIDEFTGKPIRGTEIVHLVAHKGRLYAGNGYWMDSRGYANIPWSQVLVLDSPDAVWKVDLALGPKHLRVTALQSVTFTTDGDGKALAPPVNLLLAASDRHQQSNIWTRDDANDTWLKTTLQAGGKYRRSTRAFAVHRDQKTGVDRIFVAAGALGVYSGVYDADQPGKIRWDKKAELGPVVIRPMSFAEANGSLYASAGTSVYRRTDGPAPRWEKVHSDNTPEHWELGGIRGLTAVASPGGSGESILFSHTDRIIRLDPNDDHKATIELKIRELLEKASGRAVKGNIIAAYSFMLPLTDPATGRTVLVIGVQGRLEKGRRDKVYSPHTFFGYYPGGSYLIRESNQSYRLKEVNGRWKPGKPMLLAARTCAISPFPDHAAGYVYFGGFDANFFPARDTAWIFRASVKTVLSAKMSRPTH